VTGDTRHRPKFIQKLEAQRDRHADRHFVVRWLSVAVGFTLLLGGVVMLVAPGPAFVVIPIGLAILSLQFRWAENLLEHSLIQADKAKKAARETSRTQKILSAIATALAIAAVAVWAVWGDIPLLPV
jgi:uncharacterized protein (TIGR02611 family)